MAQRLSMAELLKLKKRMSGSTTKVTASSDSDTGRSGGEPAVVEGATLLQKIEKLAFQNSMCLPLDMSGARPAAGTRRIAVCLVIVDCLLHEDLWRSWVESSNVVCAAELYIHAKHPDAVKSPWVRQRLLPGTFLPEWNSVEVVRAMLAVLEVAVKDQNYCDRFLFATETCIPLYDLQDAGERIYGSGEVSWLDAYSEPQHAFESGVFRSVDPAVIPPALVWKALPGWILLTRRHAVDVLSLHRRVGGEATDTYSPPIDGDIGAFTASRAVDLPHAFRNVYAPEEIFFPTMLAICGHLTDRRLVASNVDVVIGSGNAPQVLKRRVTHAEWRAPSDPNPIMYDTLSESMLHSMRETGAVFGRKFSKGFISAAQWSKLVAIRRPQPVGNVTINDQNGDETAKRKRKRTDVDTIE